VLHADTFTVDFIIGWPCDVNAGRRWDIPAMESRR